MTEEFEKMMQKTTRNINVGYLSALFDTAIEYIAKIAVDERISEPIHKTVNPMLDDMIGQLHSMKNNMMATIMFENNEKMKVAQPIKMTEQEKRDCDTCLIASTCNRKTINRCDGYCWLEKYTEEEQKEIIEMRLKMERGVDE